MDVFPQPAAPKIDLKSKTFWLNLIVFLISAVGQYLGVVDVTPVGDADPGLVATAVQAVPGLFSLPVLLISAANLFLRYKTKAPVLPFWDKLVKFFE